MLDYPLVTVCIATYNRADSLPNAIRTVQEQTYQHIELIIVDDCSTDHTPDVVHNYLVNDKRITYIRHHQNKGLAAARNKAIFSAQGKYFTFIDDDDEWDTSFIQEFVTLAEQYDDNWCFCCGTKRTGRLGKVENKHANFEGKLLDYCKQGYTPPVASQFYFVSTLIRCGGYRENIKTGVDHDLWLSLAFAGVSIKSLEKYLAFPNAAQDKKRKRMTNQYDKRIRGIQASLSVWKADICKSLGSDFYHRFAHAYLIREKNEFLKAYIMDFRLHKAWKVYRDIAAYVSIKQVLRTLLLAVMYQLHVQVRKEVTSARSPELALQ